MSDAYRNQQRPQPPHQGYDLNKLPRHAALGIGAILLAGTFLGSNYQIPQTERGVITRFGAFHGIAEPGLNFKIPFTDDVKSVDMQTHKKSWENVEAYTKDTQQTHMKITVNYRADPLKLEELYSRFKGDIDSAVDRIVVPVIFADTKAAFGKFTSTEAITKRDELSGKATETIRQALTGDPVFIIEGIYLEDIRFSEGFVHSVEDRMKAEVAVQQEQQILAKKRIEAQAIVATAQGNADARVAQATAEATATRLAGEGEAAAIDAKNKALNNTSPNFVNYMATTRWKGDVPMYNTSGAPIPFMNLNQGGGATLMK